MHQLRTYQTRTNQAIEASWRGGKRAPVMVLPTGSGKTTCFAHIVRAHPGWRVLVVCPWRQLVFQAQDRFIEHGLQSGILLGSRKPGPSDRVHVSTVQTAARRKLGEYDLVVVDEAHRAIAKQPLTLLKRYDQAKLLGATATPCRTDGKPLSRAFDDLVVGATVGELMKLGHLVPDRVYAPEAALNLSKVRYDRKRRDYSEGALGRHMSQPKLLGDAVEHWNRHARGMRTFTYCVNLAHARHVLESFQRAGVAAEIIDGSTCATKRKELFDQLRSKDLRMLVSVGTLVEGVDLPELECQVLLRPTCSFVLARQIQGRGLRPSPGKSDCLVLDHADVFRRHGFPEDEKVWSLGKDKDVVESGKRSTFVPKSRKCGKCGQMISIQASTCPKCGHVELPRVAPGKLVKLDRVAAKTW